MNASRGARLCLLAILVLSGLLEFVKLSQNGFANIFYSAAVKSMLRSWHNFFFVSADPNGLITVDKPPLALVVAGLERQAVRLRAAQPAGPGGHLRGAGGVADVPDRCAAVRPRCGPGRGLALAVFPSFVAVSRDNGVDPLLILLMVATCGVGLAAIESGRLRTLVWCAVLVGLAFNTKSLAALLIVPGIASATWCCAPGSWRRRLAQLAVAGAVSLAVAASWSLAVDLTPASQRPFVGGSVDELGVPAGVRLQRLRPRRRPAGRARHDQTR